MPKKIVVVCGPTACGKTALAVELALRLNGEVVSADSMQIYQGLDTGTAKPTPEEKRGVAHHMLDVAAPAEEWSVARYVQTAVPIVDGILSRGKLPIVAGGTGLYIDALIAGREFAPYPEDSALRGALEARAAQEGLHALYRQLEQADPEAAARVHPNDAKRIIRALEVYSATGKTISWHNAQTKALPPRYEAVKLGLRFASRAAMWARIDARVEEMFARGLAREASALSQSLPENCTAMQAIGYKQLAAALKQNRSLEEAKQEIKLRTRQYAKRQLTWFRRDSSIKWYEWGEDPKISEAVAFSTEFLMENGIG